MAYELVVAILSLVIGIALGYYYGRWKAYQDTDVSHKSALLQSLTTQVTEMKAKFDAYEKLREQKEKDLDKLSHEKEKRYQEFMESTKKFYEKQDIVRVEYEKKRDDQMGKFSSIIDAFNRTIHGTKTRGMTGEVILHQYLSESIKARIIKSSLVTESGEVEFAWNLGDGKYVPIDSKLPDLLKLIESIGENTEDADKGKVRKEIIEKVKKEVERVRKYQNQPNTINKCILAVPESVVELAPEIIEIGATKNVFVCSYKQVFLIGYILAEEYEKMKDEGDMGELKDTNKNLIGILKEILKLADTVDKQAKSVIKHNEAIKDQIHVGLRL
ncbi:MAG TPA: DNA recombination protein RmuC [Candidatus Nanoarchaeia archaeon]|nr:DNA recombination protein RmuC [Candidatus Nanoarchaeia archaeon]